METQIEKQLVNPISTKECWAILGEQRFRVLDISFVRLVLEDPTDGASESLGGKDGVFEIHFDLEKKHLNAMATIQSKGPGWVRLNFEQIVPSARAHLRSFLSPKKIGESLIEDWRDESVRHFHGLNESELWFDGDGNVLFSFLDSIDYQAQFVIRMHGVTGPLSAGKLLRTDYIAMGDMENELPLLPMTDRDVYSRLSESRDIITNFRATGQFEYNWKQKLLKVMSEYLYSTGHRVEMSNFRTMKPTARSVESRPVER